MKDNIFDYLEEQYECCDEDVQNEAVSINTKDTKHNNRVKNSYIQDKCPLCGATDISLNTITGLLRCNFCREEFEAEFVNGDTDIERLDKTFISEGAIDIQEGAEDIITIKCTGCGAEIVVDTANTLQARCHWCRSFLSINEQIPNGRVPDMILPFDVTIEEARCLIDNFVKERSFYAHPAFKREFTLQNIMGVYFPYMVVDINSHAHFKGVAEHLVRSYKKSKNSKYYKYDADVYEVERDFDLLIDDLIIESSKDKLNKNDTCRTNNIVNSILPFDTKNAVKWNANYLRGYTSEKRDVNIDELIPQVELQAEDIARKKVRGTMMFYNRGEVWNEQLLKIKGSEWKSAYFPVWLYSFRQKKWNNTMLHYVVVNARTREIMGSIPINKPKLLLVSLIIEILSGYAAYLIESEGGELIFLTFGFLYYIYIYSTYRNKGERHRHELETLTKIRNLSKFDKFIKRKKGLDSNRIEGETFYEVKGNDFK